MVKKEEVDWYVLTWLYLKDIVNEENMISGILNNTQIASICI